MSRIALLVALLLIFQTFGCDQDGQQLQTENLTDSGNELSLSLSTNSSPANSWMLNLTITNASDHVAHIEVRSSEKNYEPFLTVYASQGKTVAKMHTRDFWGLIMTQAYFPQLRSIQPGEKVQYSLDLRSDFVDNYETYGKPLPQIDQFDHNLPVFVWAEIPDVDKREISAKYTSNNLLLNFDQGK